MLTCPICQTTLDNDSIQGGRCFSCGSQVTWQCAPDELAHAGTATLAGGATSDTTKQTLANGMPPAEGGFGESNTATMRSIESEFIPTDASPPKQKKFVYPAKPRPKPKSRALSIEQNNALKTIWGNTLDSDATPMTSLRSDAYVQETKKSSLVIRSRALARRIDGPQSINADYELIDHIGEGGMGVVHSARQASIDRTVAVKMLRREIADLREPREKFLSEAVVTAELDHPNIVPIHDLGASADGALFYSMKLVKGTPWCEAIFEKSLDENLSILLKVCDAVRFAHTKGVIHRDLKPENVMLGDFGEVLVMDWGLAVATSAFRCPDSITQSGNMGGTPAYMAPEMATGPIDAIDETSDVYLLGAILYEILTNKTPHFGRDPMDCLKAAAANRIQPTNVSGELMDIAMKAMSTEQMDRHSSVRSFQDSIQDYQSHAESILLSDRSEMSLQSALESEDYQEFASALHGFKEALLLWSDNPAAKSGLPQSRLEYATCAYGKEDYDLALSLLDSADPDHAALLANIERKRAERATRQKRLNGLKRIAVALFGIVIAIGALAFIMIRNDRNRAIAAHHTATAKMKEAEVAKAQEEKQRLAAVGNQKKAEQAQAAAEESAKRAADNAAEAKRLETEAARESYLALIGLAAARADENAFREANNILNGLASSPFRNWEWGRLKHVCSGTNKQFNASGRVESVSIDRSFQRVAASTRNGHATIWTISGNSPPISLPHKDHWVHGVAFSPDGRHVATACSDRMIRLFDVSSGQLLSSKEAHRDSVLQVAFSPNGSRLVSCSYDKSIAVWNVEDPRNVSISQRLQGHSWWVHDVGFSPDGNKIASAGHDGKVLVWQQDGDVSGQFKLLTEFSGHDGPVFSVRFSPDSKLLATGGHDKRVMVWDYERQDTTSIQEQLEGALAAPPVYRAFDGHRAAVRCVSFSPDGQRIVSGSVDNTLKVWDTKTGELHRTLRGHEREVRAAAFSPDGRQVVSGSFDESVRIWDVGEYRESRMLGTATVDGHTDAVMDARFSRNGKTIVTASRDRTARLWNADSGTIAQELVEGHDYLASIALFFPDGKHLLTAGGDNTVRIWDVVTGTQTQAYSGTGRDGIVALSPNSDRFATALGKHVGVWDLATGKQVRELGPHSANVTAVCYSQQFIGTADNAGGIKFWNEASGELLWESHAHNSTVTAMHISRDGQRLITASGDRTVGQWRTSDGKEIAAPLQHPDWISSIAVDADGNIAITSCEDSVVRVWDLKTGSQVGTLDVRPTRKSIAQNLRRLLRSQKLTSSDIAQRSNLDASTIQQVLDGEIDLPDDEAAAIAGAMQRPVDRLQKPKVSSVAISHDGHFALTAVADDRTVRLWDLENLTEIHPDSSPTKPLLELNNRQLWSAAFGNDSETIVTLGGSEARIWNRQTGKEQLNLSPHGTVVSARFTPDDRHVVTASWDDTAKIWDTSSGLAIRKLAGQHQGNVNMALFSPDGKHVLTCSDDRTALLWNAETGEPTGITLTGHGAAVTSAAFSLDGSRIVTASRDQCARVWNSQTGELIMHLHDPSLPNQQSHELGVLCVTYFHSSDGDFVATGGEDGTVKIWKAETGELLKRLDAHTARVTSVNASPDGSRLATASQDTTAKIWDSARGKEVLTLRGHTQEVTSVTFSPDGQKVLTASRDGLAIIWPADDWENAPTANTEVTEHETPSL